MDSLNKKLIINMSTHFKILKTVEIKNTWFGFMIVAFTLLLAVTISSGIASGHSDDGDAVAPARVTEMKPAVGDTHHLEVKPESLEGYRIPDMKITVEAIPQGGGSVIEKELDGMFGGNFHYGVNIALEPKQYLLKFHLDPPTFMREGKRASQWLEPIDAEFTFDAAASIETSGEIGTKQTSDMKIIFEAEEAESMFVLPGGEDMRMTAEPMHDDEEESTESNAGATSAIFGVLGVIVGFVLGRFLFRTKLS